MVSNRACLPASTSRAARVSPFVSPRMFQSDLIDFFSRTPWWAIPTIWIPVSLVRHLRKNLGAIA